MNKTTTPSAQPLGARRIGYIRVSSVDQNTARQLDGVQVDAVFKDHASGKDTARPQLQAALAALVKGTGDTLVVHSMDRLARSLVDLLALVKQVTDKGCRVQFVKEGQTYGSSGNDPQAVLMLSILGACAQFEREMIRDRQAEGIAKAKERGVYTGRAPALTDAQAAALRAEDADNKGLGRAALARKFGISRQTLYTYVNKQSLSAQPA